MSLSSTRTWVCYECVIKDRKTIHTHTHSLYTHTHTPPHYSPKTLDRCQPDSPTHQRHPPIPPPEIICVVFSLHLRWISSKNFGQIQPELLTFIGKGFILIQYKSYLWGWGAALCSPPAPPPLTPPPHSLSAVILESLCHAESVSTEAAPGHRQAVPHFLRPPLFLPLVHCGILSFSVP